MPIDKPITSGAHKQCAVRADYIDRIQRIQTQAAKKRGKVVWLDRKYNDTNKCIIAHYGA